MVGPRRDGRVFEPELAALAQPQADGRVELRAPAVGWWRGAPAVGDAVTEGSSIGELEVLGVLHVLRVPSEVRGRVVERGGDDRACIPVQWGEVLLVVDAGAAAEPATAEPAGRTSAAVSEGGGGVVLRATTSGRFYSRPAPDRPPFVTEGSEIGAGDPVCLLEVMKTFNRFAYEPASASGLPERARVVRVVPADGDDLAVGDPILELEALS